MALALDPIVNYGLDITNKFGPFLSERGVTELVNFHNHYLFLNPWYYPPTDT